MGHRDRTGVNSNIEFGYICVGVYTYNHIVDLTWMDTAMHDMGSLGRMLQIDLPRDWASLALHRDVWRGVVSRC